MVIRRGHKAIDLGGQIGGQSNPIIGIGRVRAQHLDAINLDAGKLRVGSAGT